MDYSFIPVKERFFFTTESNTINTTFQAVLCDTNNAHSDDAIMINLHYILQPYC